MDADIYLSPYGKSSTSKVKKIKTFAVHEPSHENSKSDYTVCATNGTNEISVSFSERSDCKVFSFDKVLCVEKSQVELDSFLKSRVQDVVMGLNSFLILCDLTFPVKNGASAKKYTFPGMLSANSLLGEILKELLIYTTNKENTNSSLLASFFEVHDDRIVDLLNKNNEIDDLKTLQVFQQNYTEIKDLTEKPIVNEDDIADIFTKQSYSLFCNSSICHSIFTASLIRKNESCDEFESIKVGKLFMVDFVKCKENVLGANIYADCDLKIPEDIARTFEEFATSSKNKLFDILKPAFGGSARTILVASVSSYLYSPERDLSILRFIDKLQNVYNYPEIDVKMIIPTSLIEYSEEIQELQKDLAAIKKKTGVKVQPGLYRFFKNSATFEEEKLKIFGHYLSSLSDSNTSMKQYLNSIHSTSEMIENEIKEEEKHLETLNLELKKLKEQEDTKQKSSAQAFEIVKMKQMRNVQEFNLKKLKSDLTEIHVNYNELTNSLKSLNADMESIASDMDSEKSFLKKTLVLLVNDMQRALPELQTQHDELMMRLNSLSAVDVLFDTWRTNTETLLSKLSDFTEEQSKYFEPPIMPLQSLKLEVVEIIENNKVENSPVLFCLVHKIKVLSDSLLATLSEILAILDTLQYYYKTELLKLGAVISSSSKTFKKCFDNISSALKQSQQHSKELESEAKEIVDFVFLHHEFKMHFHGQLNDIEHSILRLKQSFFNYNDATSKKLNEIHKRYQKTSLEHSDISEELSLIANQLSLDLNQKMTFQIEEEAKKAQKKTQELLEIQDEMERIFTTALQIENKGKYKEMQEVKKCTDSQKIEVEKCFNDYYVNMKANFNSFMNDLQTLLNVFSSDEEEMKKNFCLISSSVSSLTAFYDNYLTVLKNIYGKSETALKKLPAAVNVTVDSNEDNMSGLESIYLDEWNVVSSTPKVAEARQIDVEFEKEKMLERIRFVVEEQMSKKLNAKGLDNEGKEESLSTSTMSLPNFGSNRSIIYPKASQTSENVFKAKSSRK